MFDQNKINEITQGIDHHLIKLENFSSIIKDIKNQLYIQSVSNEKNIKSEINNIKKDLNEIKELLLRYGLPLMSEYEKQIQEIKKNIDNEVWPLSIENELISNNEEKEKSRSKGIINLFIGESLKEKKFLDFGCGNGYCVESALEQNSLAIGYDIDENKCKIDKKNFSNNFKKIIENGPYDVILLHDVLDHAVEDHPVNLLEMCRSVLAASGRIYIRNHPWCSRHGGHLYTQKNLAFLHLILDEIELMRCFGIQIEETNQKVIFPIELYREWIKVSKLKIKNELVVRTDVEDFFLENDITRNKIEKIWENYNIAKNNMEIDFVEYILESDTEISAAVF